MPTTTALYAGLLGLMAILIGFQTGQARARSGVMIGDGGNQELIIAMRRHANFIENVPLALILMALLELDGVTNLAIHALGGTLVIARACHASGMTVANPTSVFRTIGAVGSVLVLAVASVWAIWLFLS